MARFCKKCGAQVAGDLSFCANCGSPVSQETQTAPPPPTPQPASAPAPTPLQYQQATPPPAPQQFQQQQSAPQPTPQYQQAAPLQQTPQTAPQQYQQPATPPQPQLYQQQPARPAPQPTPPPTQYHQQPARPAPQPAPAPPQQYQPPAPPPQPAPMQTAPPQRYQQPAPIPQQQGLYQHQYPTQYPPSPKPKKRIGMAPIIIAVCILAVAGVALAIFMNASRDANEVQKDFIRMGQDEIPTVKLIIGVREVDGVTTTTVDGVTERIIKYKVTTNQSKEMQKYAETLLNDYGYYYVNKVNDFSGPTGKDLQLVKASVEDDHIVYVSIDYDMTGYAITLTRGRGTLTIQK